ncbi:MAG: class I SAM-dependent methyltransferase [Caldilineaceae bacterium]
MVQVQFQKSYATFGLARSLRQVKHALAGRRQIDTGMLALLRLVQESEQRIQRQLGRNVEGLRMLEIGPGQGLERARYFGRKNEVTGIDLDVIPVGFDLKNYLRMWRENGAGRAIKSMGRRILIGRANEIAWASLLGVEKFNDPILLHGNICEETPALGQFDVIMSWSVFEHLPDPAQALQQVLTLLKPGGVFYISLHLYTANNGHHDIRAFTGDEETLPLWGHLRPTTDQMMMPSAYLNKWRLAQWRHLFTRVAPGHQEFLETYESYERFQPRMTEELRHELAAYTDEELYTVDAVYTWRKPTA